MQMEINKQRLEKMLNELITGSEGDNQMIRMGVLTKSKYDDLIQNPIGDEKLTLYCLGISNDIEMDLIKDNQNVNIVSLLFNLDQAGVNWLNK